MAVKTKLFMAALTLVLLANPLLARVIAAQSGDTDVFGEDDLPLGLQLTETLHTIINEHKLAIKNAILEFRLKHDELIENKTELIKGLIDERINRTLQIREAIEELSTLYAAGNITLGEYLARLSGLRSELKALAKSMEKLGEILKKFASEMKEIVKEKVEKLREINREFGKKVSEEARRIRERIKKELREEGLNSTSTTGLQPQNENRDGERNSHPSNITVPQAGGAAEQHRGNVHENSGRGHDTVSTSTTTVTVDEERNRGRNEGHEQSSNGRGRGR